MNIRMPLALVGATALAVTTGLVTTAPTATSAAPTKSYAYGLSINGEGKQPYVESTDGSTQTQGTPDFPSDLDPAVSGTIAQLQAGDDFASVRVADLTVGQGLAGLPTELKDGIGQLTQLCTEAVQPATEPTAPVFDGIRENAPTELELADQQDVVAFCTGLLDNEVPALVGVTGLEVQCDGDSGAVTLAGVSLLGADLPLAGEIEPDTKLLAGDAAPLAEAAQVTFNRQTSRGNGAFDVDGMVISLGGGEGEIIVGHTTCGEPLRRETGQAPGGTPRQAEAPTPVRQSVPVTG